jgi:plasmid stabilization system protein ParE
MVAEIGNEIIRELIEGNYRIIYKIVNDSRIDILTIHHSSRDLLRRNI